MVYIYMVYIYIHMYLHTYTYHMCIYYHNYYFIVTIYSNTPRHHFPSSHSADDASWMPWIDTTRAQERIMPFLLDPAW